MNYNNTIINEFKKLIEVVQMDIDNNKSLNEKEINQNTFRLKSLKNILNILKKYPKQITLENLSDLKDFPGIGDKTIKRIKEILETGKISEISDYKENKNAKLIEELESVVGIGHKIALDFIKKGIKSIYDLKNKIKNKEIKVNDKIKLGLKYYGKFFDKIPREEITNIKNILNDVITIINKEHQLDKEKYIFEICGSYRRNKPYCGDIDVLVSKYKSPPDNFNHLKQFIEKLKLPIKLNNNKPLLVDDITDKKYTTKYMGFAKYKNNLIRRIDIRYVPWTCYYPALLYFTGSAEFNQKIRKIARDKGYKLSEYSLTKILDGSQIKIKSEQHIFDLLNVTYIEPEFR
jgi:DNA polymerase/3'-5' exonuclease PolX